MVFFDFEIESSEKGYFSFYLCQEVRGKGLGSSLLKQALLLPEINKVSLLEGGVEKDNQSSIKTLEKVGFKHTSIDEDGMWMYQFMLK